MQLPVKVKVVIEGDEITIDLTGSSDEVPTGLQLPLRGHDRLGDDVHRAHDLPRRGGLPRLRAPERGDAAAGQRDRAEGLDLQPQLSRARASPASARCSGPSTSRSARSRRSSPSRSPPATRRTCTSSPTPASTRRSGEYWVYLEVDEGSLRRPPGRDGLDSVDCLIANTRNNPIEELEWRFPMRTERYELRDDPCAAGQVARRDRHRARQPLPRRHDRHLRGRPPRLRPAVGHLRRPRRDQRVDVRNAGRADEERWPSKFTASAARGRRHARDHGAELRRLRRPARARPGARALRRPRRLHDRSSSPSATTAS